MTKEQLLQLIQANITTNGNNEITGHVAATVLGQMVHSIYGVDGMGSFVRFRGLATTSTNPVLPKLSDVFIAKYNAANDQTFTHFSGAVVLAGELALLRYNGSLWVKNSVGTFEASGGSGTMTAAEIRDALETLTTTNRLNKSAIQGIDFPLNFKAFEDISNYAYMNTNYPTTLQGEFFVGEDIQTDIGMFDGDIIVALVDNPTFEANYSNKNQWLALKFNSPAIIKSRLEALETDSRLNKSAIRGAETALNRKGSVKWDAIGGQNTIMTSDPQPGDFWIYADGGSPSESYDNGDILILKSDTLPDPVWDLTDSTKFEIWPLSKLTTGTGSLTAAQIAALLNANATVDEMVTSNRIKHSAGVTVSQKITAIDLSIAGKQEKLYHERYFIEDSGGFVPTSFTVTGKELEVVSLNINRVPYYGREGGSFAGALAGMDFRYAHASGNTTFHLNPNFTDPALQFAVGDIIDIIHASTAITSST